MSGTSHPPYNMTLSYESDWASITFSSSGENKILISSSSSSGISISSDKRTLLAGQKLSNNYQRRDVKFVVSSTNGTLDFELGHGVSGSYLGDNGGYAELFVDVDGTPKSLGSSKTDGAKLYRVAIQI